ncbi:PblA [uncultured Streptococcus sp.]|uniref:phage tail protein n=2 Tax=Streptococcus TaxID=1301 RepID=UPI0028D6EF62|nr:PblA [uncultured Streptococcus sp.]
MATELGKAYVQIIPSAKGISGMIQKELGGEVASAGTSAGQSLGSKMMGALSGVIAAAGIGKAIGASITEGAALQQSLGGIETLFKDSADKVKGFANEAYKTTGLSANAYMENVTGFSASLLQSLGGDTDKAADIANMAMIDMSDNANKMGTSMESIQLAYQGFAKQNYTMLDNLKLGYGGTKQEMQRLLADAEKLTGVKYDINNLSDVYSAIHAIQENLDITGTTAREAATTFTGSFESMKAAAQNVLGKIAIGENVTPALQSLLETTKTFLFGNFLPMIGNILSGLGVVLTEGLSSLASQLFGEAFGSAVYNQIGRVTGIFQTFFDMIFGSMDKEGNFEILDALGFSEDAANQIINIADNIRVTFENIGSVIGNVGSIVADFVGGFLGIQDSGQNVNLLGTTFEFLSNVLKGASSILKDITGLLKEHPGIVSAVASAVIGLTTAWKTYKAVSLATKTIESAKNAIFNISFALSQARAVASGTLTAALAAENAAAVGASGSFSLFNAVMSANPIVLVVGAIAALVAALAWFFTQTETGRQIWQGFMDWLSSAWQSISSTLSGVWNGIVETATTVWNNMMAVVATIIQAVVDFVKSVWDGISLWWTENQGLIQQTFETVWNAIQTVIQTVMPIIQSVIETAMNILGPLIEGTWNNICTVVTTVWELIKIAIQTAMDVISGIITAVMAIINSDWSTAWEAIKGVGEAIWNGLSAAGQAIFDGFAQILSNIWNTIKSVASSAWEGLKSTVLGLIDGLVQGAQRAWESMKQGVSDLVSNVTSIFDGIRNIDLWSAGKAILDGFLGGLKSAWGAVTDFVGGIAGWIADHKGPIEYDRKLLIPAGNAIMQGLDRGLQDRFKGVKKSVSGMAGEISNAFSNDDFGLSGTPTIAKNIEASLAMPSAQIEAKDSQTVSEIAILRASMEKILTAILEKPSDTYLDADKISMSVYQRQGAIYAREGI